MQKDQISREKICFDDDFPVLLRKFQGIKPQIYGFYYHAPMEFHLFNRGNGQYFINDTNYPLGMNTVIITHKNEIHSYIPDNEPSIMSDTFLIFATHLLRYRPVSCAALRRLEQVHHLVLSNNQAIVAEFLLNNIGDEYSHKDKNWQQHIINQIESFLIILQRAADRQFIHDEKKDPIIQEVIKYVDERFMEDLSLLEISNQFSLSSYSLCRKFKQYVGLGFKKYLIHRRIIEAKMMLEETNIKITAIAYKVGFDSISTFNRDFRMLTGIPPADYRKLAHSSMSNYRSPKECNIEEAIIS